MSAVVTLYSCGPCTAAGPYHFTAISVSHRAGCVLGHKALCPISIVGYQRCLQFPYRFSQVDLLRLNEIPIVCLSLDQECWLSNVDKYVCGVKLMSTRVNAQSLDLTAFKRVKFV